MTGGESVTERRGSMQKDSASASPPMELRSLCSRCLLINHERMRAASG